MKKYLSLLLFILLGFVFIGCDNTITTQENIAELSDHIDGFSSYDDMADYFSNMQTNYMDYGVDSVLEGTPEVTMDGAEEDGGNERSNYSETNVQVDGIAEMDSIITDGYYIYMAKGQTLRIIDVDTMSVVYENNLTNGYYQGIFLYEGRLVSLYTKYTQYNNQSDEYIYDFWWGYSSLFVDVIDVSNKDNVEVVRTLEFLNSYLTDVRMIDDQMYLMMTSYQWNMWAYAEDSSDTSSEETTNAIEENVFIPKYKDSTISDEYLPLSWTNIYFFPENDYTSSYLLVGSFSVTDEEAIDLNAYLGYAFEVYMSHENLYVAGSQYVYDEENEYYTQYTNILRFEVLEQGLVFRASNRIEGWTLNQFSFDEYDGVLRVATTIFNWDRETWENDVSNQLYLLDATDSDLTLISTLEGLGKPNERIYAVRMSGEIGYVVTFVNTDPLYKIDLSDPENPEVIGELYEEGVSDYLHPLDNDLMIGIGRQAVTEEEWTRFVGVKVALYDVSGDDPVALETLLVEGEYSYSPVTYNHKLFVEYTWDESYLFAIPVYGYNDDYSRYYQAIYVYEVDGEDLIQKAVLTEENEGYYYWGNIEKAIFIGDSIYTISYTQITEYDMNDDFSLIDTLVLETFDYDDEETTEESTESPDDTTEVHVEEDTVQPTDDAGTAE